MPQYIDKINLPGNREYEMRDSIAEMKDVSLASLASGQALVYNGSSWVNAEVPKELPSLTNNANKILAVNHNASDVEWIADNKPDVVYSYDPNNIIYSQSGNMFTNPVWHTLTNVDLTPYHHLMVYAVPIKNTVGLSTDNISTGMVMEVSMDSYNITSDMPYYSGGTLVPYANNDNRLYTGAVLVNKTANDEWQIAFKTVSLYGTSSTDVTTSYIYKIEGCYDSEIGAASGSGGDIPKLGELDDVSLRTPVITGDILRYDQDNRIWYNTRIPSELPSQTGNSGKFLTTNGSTVSWAEVQGGSGSGATTLADLTDTSVSGAANGDHLIYRNGYWTAMKFRGFEKASFNYVLSTSHNSEIILSDDMVGDYSICDYHVEIDGTIQLPTITIDELSTECVNFYLKNTNTSNPQGVNLRLVPGSNYIDYAIYDDGNIRYGANGIDINIPRNKVIELSIKAYNATNYDQVLAIVYSDPLTIQSI